MKIAIGQYIPGNSVIHKMDPRFKIFITILMIVLVFIAPYYLATLLIIIPVFFAFFIARIKFRKILSLLKPIIFLLVFLFIINIIVITPRSDVDIIVYYSWKFFYISFQAIMRTLQIVLRVFIMIVITTVLITTTKPLDLTRGIEDLMYPLKLIKVPVHIIAMIISIALRFIPTLLIEAERIMRAQASRGVDFKHGNFKAKIKSTITLIIPLFVSAFAKAEDLSNAMETRSYDPYAKRTRYRHYVPSFFDYCAMTFALGLLVLFIFLKIDFFPLPVWWY